MRRVSLRITVSIKRQQSFKSHHETLFFSIEPCVKDFQNLRKAPSFFLPSLIFDTEFTVKMAPKTKPVASSLSAVAPEVQIGGSSTQEAPILGKELFDVVFTIKGLEELS